MSLSQFQGMFAPYEGKSVVEYEEMYSRRKQRKAAEQLMSSFGDRALTRADYMKLQQIDPSYVKEILTNENAIRTALAPPALTPQQKMEMEIKKHKIKSNIDQQSKLADTQADVAASQLNLKDLNMPYDPKNLPEPESQSVWSSILSTIGLGEEQTVIDPNTYSPDDLIRGTKARLEKEGWSTSQINEQLKDLRKRIAVHRKLKAKELRAKGFSTPSVSNTPVSQKVRSVPSSSLFTNVPLKP